MCEPSTRSIWDHLALFVTVAVIDLSQKKLAKTFQDRDRNGILHRATHLTLLTSALVHCNLDFCSQYDAKILCICALFPYFTLYFSPLCVIATDTSILFPHHRPQPSLPRHHALNNFFAHGLKCFGTPVVARCFHPQY